MVGGRGRGSRSTDAERQQLPAAAATCAAEPVARGHAAAAAGLQRPGRHGAPLPTGQGDGLGLEPRSGNGLELRSFTLKLQNKFQKKS